MNPKMMVAGVEGFFCLRRVICRCEYFLAGVLAFYKQSLDIEQEMDQNSICSDLTQSDLSLE